jgi:hypothetical protein
VTAIALHALGLPIRNLRSRADQLGVLIDVGVNIGALFAGLLGALLFTVEVRHGTIRPTFLATPRRMRVIAAKATVALIAGAGLGGTAAAVAVAAGRAFFHMRGITIFISAGNEAHLILGAALAGACWALIGLGAGALVRSQVPVVVGLIIWVLFIETTLGSTLSTVAKFAPAALARGVAGAPTDALSATPVALVLLVLYAAAALIAGSRLVLATDIA